MVWCSSELWIQISAWRNQQFKSRDGVCEITAFGCGGWKLNEDPKEKGWLKMLLAAHGPFLCRLSAQVYKGYFCVLRQPQCRPPTHAQLAESWTPRLPSELPLPAIPLGTGTPRNTLQPEQWAPNTASHHSLNREPSQEKGVTTPLESRDSGYTLHPAFLPSGLFL